MSVSSGIDVLMQSIIIIPILEKQVYKIKIICLYHQNLIMLLFNKKNQLFPFCYNILKSYKISEDGCICLCV